MDYLQRSKRVELILFKNSMAAFLSFSAFVAGMSICSDASPICMMLLGVSI